MNGQLDRQIDVQFRQIYRQIDRLSYPCREKVGGGGTLDKRALKLQLDIYYSIIYKWLRPQPLGTFLPKWYNYTPPLFQIITKNCWGYFFFLEGGGEQPKTTTEPVGIFPKEQNLIGSVVIEILKDKRKTDGQTDIILLCIVLQI